MGNSNNVIDEEPHLARGAIGGIGVDRPPLDSLPREFVRPVSWSKVASTWVATIAVVGLFNVVADIYLSHYTPNRGYWLIEQKWALLNKAERPIDWVIVGDSSCNQGIDTETWNQTLNVRSLNLCTFGPLLPLNDVWMLNALSERIGYPANVLVVHVYDVWHRSTTPELLGRIPERSVWSTGKYSVTLTLPETARELMSRYLPLISQNAALRYALGHPLALFESKFKLGENGYMREVTARPRLVAQEVADHLQAMNAHDFTISDENQAALRGLREFADTHGVNIYLTHSPVNDELYASSLFRDRVAPMQSEFRAWAASSPRLHYLEGFETYPKELMQGADHVIDEGARDFTQRMAQIVQQQ